MFNLTITACKQNTDKWEMGNAQLKTNKKVKYQNRQQNKISTQRVEMI